MGMYTKTFIRSTGMRLKKVRYHLGYSRFEMSRRLGIVKTTYYKNENGGSFPNFNTLKILSNDYDISMDWFIFGRGPMFLDEKEDVEELETELAEEQQKIAALEKELVQTRELETVLEKVKKELAEEQKKTAALEQEREQAKMAEEDTANIEKKPEVKELLEAMSQTPLLFHEVLAYFHRFKKENKESTDVPAN